MRDRMPGAGGWGRLARFASVSAPGLRGAASTRHMGWSKIAVLAQLGTTLPLVGLIWFVQVVAYPQFARVDAASFPAYHAAHASLISYLVGPLMVVELGACLLAVAARPPSVSLHVAIAGLALCALAWGVTGLVSVPLHETLGRGFHAEAHARLVSTNWLRTAAWTARGALLLWSLTRAPEL